MSVKIGDVRSMNDPQGEKITPDDRQTMIEVYDGVVVQDWGRAEDGDRITWSLQFDAKAWELVKGYWTNRTIVSITDAAKQTFTARVLVRSWSRVSSFPDCVNAEIELWRV